MAGQNQGFNGTTCTVAGTTYKLTGLGLKIAGAKVDISDISQTAMIFKSGIPDFELTLDIKGTVTPAVAAEGAVVLTFKDQNASAYTLPGRFIVLEVNITGKINDALTATVTICPTVVDT